MKNLTVIDQYPKLDSCSAYTTDNEPQIQNILRCCEHGEHVEQPSCPLTNKYNFLFLNFLLPIKNTHLLSSTLLPYTTATAQNLLIKPNFSTQSSKTDLNSPYHGCPSLPNINWQVLVWLPLSPLGWIWDLEFDICRGI